MRTVWKFNLSLTAGKNDIVDVEMPIGAVPIFVGIEPLHPHNPTLIRLWAIVETRAEKEIRQFRIAGTGHPITDDQAEHYVGSVVCLTLVWHVFERTQ